MDSLSIFVLALELNVIDCFTRTFIRNGSYQKKQNRIRIKTCLEGCCSCLFLHVQCLLTFLVNCVSCMKLCTCFSALLSSSFRARTATTNAVQPAPCVNKETTKQRTFPITNISVIVNMARWCSIHILKCLEASTFTFVTH